MIHFLGLLRPELEHLAVLGWSLYGNEARAYQVEARFGGGNRFNLCFGVTPKPRIHLVGVWDTVSSFGWIWDFQTLPYTATNPSLDHLRHALAIDERRACFPANLYFPSEEQRPNCKQVWFAGVHSDVGGGYPEEQSSLAKVPLAWLLREAEALGLLVNPAQRDSLLNSPGPGPCGPTHESLKGIWWLLESLPRRSWDNTVRRMRWHGPHLGRRRPIAEGSVLHASVLERMQRLGYSPGNLPKDYGVES
jgi:uncharacterized protein (DUF2235 family)